MMVSTPTSPEGAHPRQQSFSTPSPEAVTRPRLQGVISARPARSNSRMSQASSSRAGTIMSEEEVKTAVKVVVRVRPPLGPSDPGFDLIPLRFHKSMVTVNTNTSLAVDSPQGRKVFVFDRVLGAETTQKGLWEYLEDSVDSFILGYNVSILAYGQSGSGKSYTMGTSGPVQQSDASSKGVIPRAADHLFRSLSGASQAASHTRQNSNLKTPSRISVGSLNTMMSSRLANHTEKDWSMSVTYVEIYNEQPRDLLLPEATPITERPSVQIREDARGRIFVEGLKSVQVNSMEELMAVLNHGSSIRQTDATAINSKSSRSHAIFTVNLRQTKPLGFSTPVPKDRRMTIPDSGTTGDAQITVESKLHFVDLAGSERLKNTGATGDRAKEGISINAGLANLGKVIAQLSSRSGTGHVSYRDSKLTRILQDSLGGNAITYMVACVTPAEFHLSETLNTVQYAQRARNIQSKPKIQQINDDADKQAMIDRLKQEVDFLRQQIRSTDGTERRSASVMERSHERETELHNQLLDVQESYGALSQRHAKLIADLAKTSSSEDPIQSQVGENAADRLKRSQDHQQQIEQVIIEYEKTIQNLEADLQTTRSSLASTESNLLEKETKCAYVETMNQQLNSRVQKLMEREANTESYLHELEARLDEQSSGGEKHDAIVSELRKEMVRIRASETNAEDYICTLEERLAEADQDMEILQREVERLEQLVERQRGIGKLDGLLHGMDQVQKVPKGKEAQNDISDCSPSKPHHSRKHSKEPMGVLKETEEADLVTQIRQGLREPDSDDERERDAENEGFDEQIGISATSLAHAGATDLRDAPKEKELPSPAQQSYVAEKFESVSQELFDLKIEHENTVNEYDLLSAKYQEALRALANMQDSYDGSLHESFRSVISPELSSRPTSYLGDSRLHEVKPDEQVSPTRSLSSELSLAGESATSVEPAEVTVLPPSRSKAVAEHLAEDGPGSTTPDVGKLQVLLNEHERNMKDVSERYSQLQIEHDDALRQVERLKKEVRLGGSKDPGSPNMPGMIRRMTSNVSSGIDRGQRSIVSLRSLIAEQLDGKTDVLETAEIHLGSATQEMQTRMERIQNLEAEIKNAKKELDLKSTIISGLTRERNSVRSGTPVDLSIVSQMRDQLIQKERELKLLHEGYARRELELQSEITRLNEESKLKLDSPSIEATEKEARLRALEEELAILSGKHEDAQQSARIVEKRLTITAAELEAARALSAHHEGSPPSEPKAVQADHTECEQSISKLKEELEEQVQINKANSDQLTQLTAAHEAATKELISHHDAVKARAIEIEQHKLHIAGLEEKIQEAKSAVEFHKHGLKSLHEAHANEVEEMKLSHAGLLAGYDDKYDDMVASHEKYVKELDQNIQVARTQLEHLVKEAGQALGHSTSQEMLSQHIRDLMDEKKSAENARNRLMGTNAELERQLDGRKNLEELEESIVTQEKKIANYQETIRSLANEVGNHEETIRDREKTIKRHDATILSINLENNKKMLLIEELEQQLATSYEHHQNRVSVIQAQGNQALVDAQTRISALEKEVQRTSMAGSEDLGSRTNTMKSQNRPQSPNVDKGQRSDSMTSNLRKSASIASLPSPPPAIPLPPLPALPGISIAQASNPSPPQSRHTSKELAPPINGSTTPTGGATADPRNHQTIRRQSAIIEDQDLRLKNMDKQLQAEKQLTATLEEALVDLETQSNKLRVDAEGWKKKAWAMEEELASMRKERRTERLSVQAVEEEVKKRREAEAARAQLEERMRLLQGDGGKKKKKGGGLNCF